LLTKHSSYSTVWHKTYLRVHLPCYMSAIRFDTSGEIYGLALCPMMLGNL